jgi:hypothetical protein
MSDLPAATRPSADPVQVAVTVTTIRTEQEDGVHHSSAQGDFDTAIREALSSRLAPWAIDQVLGRVLARRPAAGDAVEYEGSFTPERHVRITVEPAEPTDQPPPCRTRRLAGLFLPIPAEQPPVLVASTPGTTDVRPGLVQMAAPSPTSAAS